MKLIREFANEKTGGEVEVWVQLQRAESEYTWMPKAVWDELEAQAEQSGTL